MQARLSALEIDVRPFTSLSAAKFTNVFCIGVGARITRREGIVKVVRLNDDLLVVVSIVSSDTEKACSEVEAAGGNINTTLTGKMNELLTQNPPCDLYAIKNPSERIMKQMSSAHEPSDVVRKTGSSVKALSNSPYLYRNATPLLNLMDGASEYF